MSKLTKMELVKYLDSKSVFIMFMWKQKSYKNGKLFYFWDEYCVKTFKLSCRSFDLYAHFDV